MIRAPIGIGPAALALGLATTAFSAGSRSEDSSTTGVGQAEAGPVLEALPAEERIPWVFPVPDGTPVRAFRPLADESLRPRDRALRLVEELVIGEQGNDQNYLLGERTPRLAVDDGGNIYVADTSQQRVLVYDPEGRHLHTLGREGSGPGEFVQPMVAVVAGDAVYVSDTARARLSKWTLDGALLWDKQLDIFPGYLIAPQVPLPGGSWLMRFRLPRTADEVVARMSAEGEFLDGRTGEAPLARHTRITRPERVWYPPRPPGASRAGQFAFFAGRTPPTFAFSPAGEIYVSTYEEYQILALTSDGEPRWALQVPWPRPPLAAEEKAWGTQLMRDQGYPGAEESEFEWPAEQFALGDVKVDGRGRVFVFPYVPRGFERQRFPVDVFSAAGEPFFSGWMELHTEAGRAAMSEAAWPGIWKFGPMLDTAWQVAVGDAVYGVVEDPATHEWKVVRYRIVWPS